MGLLVLGLVLFLSVHSVSIVCEAWRDRMVTRFGEGPWKALCGLVSLAGLVLIVWGYGLARPASEVVYVTPFRLRHLAMLLLVPVFPLLLATYFPGRIKAFVQHPMLLAVLFWAVAHLLVNGRMADIVLFGSFLAWGALDLFSMTWRKPRPTPGAPPSALNDVVVLVAGLALYVLFLFWLHALLIGVPLVGF